MLTFRPPVVVRLPLRQPLRLPLRLPLLLLLSIGVSATVVAQASPPAPRPRSSTSSSTTPSSRALLPADLAAFLRGWLRAGADGTELFDATDSTSAEARTWAAVASLPFEARHPPAYLVYLTGRAWCGTGGCTLLVVAQDGVSSQYRVAGDIRIARLPISVLATHHGGWPDLGVWAAGGGMPKPRQARIRYDGERYVGNPSTAPRVSGRRRTLLSDTVPRTLIWPASE